MTLITARTGIGSGLGRTATKENLDKAGKQFESVFTGMMLASMRKAKLADPLFSSKAIDTFRDMQDKQVAQIMAEKAPMGIGKALTQFLGTEFLAKAQPDLNPDASKVAE